MAGKGEASGILQALRDSANAALRRLAPAASDAPPPPAFASLDPTKTLFPGEQGEDERPGALPLATLLEDAAHAMARRKEELREKARNLAARINERREGEMTLAAQAVRVLIGLGWAGVAGWLYLAVLNARADGISIIAGGVPVDDASVLMRTFMIVALAALGVAFAVAALARALGNADNGRIKAEAEQLGSAIAAASTEFDDALSRLRGAMDARGHPADAVDELARAHVTALEAHDFFREISFISGEENEHARRMFRGFLARASGGGAGFPALIAFGIGGLFGAALVYARTLPQRAPQGAVESSALAIMQYPWAAQIIIFGGLAYAGAGAALSLFSGPLTEPVAAKARAEALAALRSGFAAQSALHPADVTRRIKDAVDIFRARVGGAAGRNQRASNDAPRGSGANQASVFSTEEDIPEWRRRDSSVEFVASGFSPAPESWRTDAYAKKFEGAKERDTAAKRGGEGLINRDSD